MPSKNLSFRAPEALLEKISLRDPEKSLYPGAIAKREVGRWYEVLGEALKDVRVTPDEAVVLIVCVMSSTPVHENVVSTSARLCTESLDLGGELDEAQESLAVKMGDWPLMTVYAAWDAAERYEVLALNPPPEGLTFGMALHQVGLHTYDLEPETLAHIERTPAVPAAYLGEVYVASASLPSGSGEEGE